MNHVSHEQLEQINDAVNDVINERFRQILEEGFNAAHDDEHNAGELCSAASAYAIYAGDQIHPLSMGDGFRDGSIPDGWLWDASWWKPKTPRENLIKAAALIIAEIERLDRNPQDTVINHD